MENEIWKDVLGYEGLYQVSNIGRIKSMARYIVCGHGGRNKRETILKNQTHPQGYPQIELNVGGKFRLIKIHRLVAESFLPNPNGLLVVNHINGIKEDNRVENIEWCTHQHNIIHAVKTGLRKVGRGEKSGNVKLKESDIPQIRALVKTNSQRNVAKMFGVTQGTVQSILKGKTWNHI